MCLSFRVLSQQGLLLIGHKERPWRWLYCFVNCSSATDWFCKPRKPAVHLNVNHTDICIWINILSTLIIYFFLNFIMMDQHRFRENPNIMPTLTHTQTCRHLCLSTCGKLGKLESSLKPTAPRVCVLEKHTVTGRGISHRRSSTHRSTDCHSCLTD